MSPITASWTATRSSTARSVRKYGRTETLYLMPWSNMFPLGITAATIGICEGMLFHANEYQADRINAQGTAVKDDPYTLFAIGQATADIRAARDTLLANVDRMWDRVDAGKEVTFEQRAEGRQTQVQAAWRAINAIDQVYPRCGGNALRMDKPLQRFWPRCSRWTASRNSRAGHRFPRRITEPSSAQTRRVRCGR